MRADATHTANIEREPRCSLYVRPSTQPPGVLSRATLIGSLVKLDDDAAEMARAQYDDTHGSHVGVDASAAADVYYELIVDRVFYVGGLGSDKRAEVVDAEALGGGVTGSSVQARQRGGGRDERRSLRGRHQLRAREPSGRGGALGGEDAVGG